MRREEEELEARLAEIQRREERERQDNELIEAQQFEADRIAKERQEREFQEQLAEAQRRERERQEREFQAQLAEAQRKERERLEEEQFQAQLAEVQRQERERQERERLEAELAEAQRRERERQDEERVEALRLEVERRERERREREWVEAQLAEVQQRKERERQERERQERERLDAQMIELQRKGARPPPLVPVADWQPVAVAQGQASTWTPVSERAVSSWSVAEVSNGRASDYAPPPLPHQFSDGGARAVRALAPPRERYSASDTVLFIHEVPERMWLGEPVLVRVCLGRGTIAGFSRAFAARAGLDLEGDPVAETVSMSLYGRGDVFEIERQSERVQLLPSNHLLDSPLELADYGRWVWHVTPAIHGEHELFLRVSALFRDRRGVPTPVALPDQKVEVFVSVPAGGSIIQSLAGWLRR